ncbi:MAG: tetratricopeptide repeat protein [Saprospiraceae bacterium]|nr:tetratricopeptide repeat protein [Saprospiraceae bacterium]
MAKTNSKPTHTTSKDRNHEVTTSGKLQMTICAILFLVGIMVYANTLHHSFVLDDPLAIGLNKNVTSGLSGIDDIIRGGYRENNFGGKLYRPVSLILFAAEWSLSPDNPVIHHFFNIIWFSLCVVFIYLVTSRWLGPKNIVLPLIISVIFAVHPIHTEVVANIKSRDEIMALFFILASLLSWDKYFEVMKKRFIILSMILYFLALISKESAITMFPLFGMTVWFIYRQTWRASLSKGTLFVIPVILLFVIRHAIFGGSPDVLVDVMDNPIVAATGMLQHFATSMLILGKYLFLEICPWPLSSDYSYQVIPLVGLNDWRVWTSILVHLGLLLFAIKGMRDKQIIAMMILSYLMAIVLYCQIPVVIGTMFGERLAFLPSLWFICTISYLAGRLWLTEYNGGDIKQYLVKNKLFLAGAIGITLLFGFITMERNRDWKDNLTLFTKDAATYPQSVRLNNGAAEQILQASDKAGLKEEEVNTMLSQAEKYCDAIMKIKPVATAYLTMGNIRLKQKRYDEAIKYYDQVNDLKAIVDANKALSYREMGRNAGQNEQNLPKSQELLTKSLALNDADAETWFLMGVSYGMSGNHQKAAEHFEKAYALKPGSEYAKNVVMAYQMLGNQAKVMEYQKLIK